MFFPKATINSGCLRSRGSCFTWRQAGWQQLGRSPGAFGSQNRGSRWHKRGAGEAAAFPWPVPGLGAQHPHRRERGGLRCFFALFQQQVSKYFWKTCSTWKLNKSNTSLQPGSCRPPLLAHWFWRKSLFNSVLEANCSTLVWASLGRLGPATKKTDYPNLTMERVGETVGEFKPIYKSLLWKLHKTMFFFKKMQWPISHGAHVPSSIADVHPGVWGPACPEPRHRHQPEVSELSPHGNQTPLMCLSSGSQDQKSPSPMETGAGRMRSHGISEAIRSNWRASRSQHSHTDLPPLPAAQKGFTLRRANNVCAPALPTDPTTGSS